MIKIFFYKIGWLQKYEIVYGSMIYGSGLSSIDYYDFKFIPEPFLRERALKWLKGKIQTCFSDLVYLERIGNHIYKDQFCY